MKISILCSNHHHPIYPWLVKWSQSRGQYHEIELLSLKKNLTGGDILFLISCHEIIDSQIRNQYSVSLVIHASDLPKGRGWSPHVWQVLEGSNDIVVSLLEAVDGVDSGPIWCKKSIKLQGHELADEINVKLFELELELMDFSIANFGLVKPQLQDETKATYYPKRTPRDSQLDPDKTIAEQFDLLRVSDSNRFPAFIEYRGFRYNLNIENVGQVGEKKG